MTIVRRIMRRMRHRLRLQAEHYNAMVLADLGLDR